MWNKFDIEDSYSWPSPELTVVFLEKSTGNIGLGQMRIILDDRGTMIHYLTTVQNITHWCELPV